MADPLSVTASIIAILQLADSVIKYSKDVADAKDERSKCAREAVNTIGLLNNLHIHLQAANVTDPWYQSVLQLAEKDGPLDQFKAAIEKLTKNTEQHHGLKKATDALKWHFTKPQMMEILDRIVRLKILVQVALQLDHFKLSQAIKDETGQIQVAVDNVLREQARLQDGQQSLAQGQQRLEAGQALMQDMQMSLEEEARSAKIRNWLSDADFASQQQDFLRRRQSGTGQWFLDAPEFTSWLAISKGTLYCPGIPGAGKTIMSSIVVDHLLSNYINPETGIVYLFCNYKAAEKQTPDYFAAAMLAQLWQMRKEVRGPLTDLHHKHLDGNSQPSFENLSVCLRAVCAAYKTVYVVVDALDECDPSVRSSFLSLLRQVQEASDLRMMATSRLLPEIMEVFDKDPTLRIKASSDDVKNYLEAKIKELPPCVRKNQDLQESIVREISEVVDGMFLLARLHIDSLKDKRTRRAVNDALAKLPKGSEAIDEAYEKALERINMQPKADVELANQVLGWIIYAIEPLSPTQLRYALALEEEDEDADNVDEDNFVDSEDMLAVCAGLVTLDETSKVIKLVHYTAQEFFEKIMSSRQEDMKLYIAKICLSCLSIQRFQPFNPLKDYGCDTLADKDRPFCNYAATYWGQHALQVQSSILERCCRFLDNKTNIKALERVTPRRCFPSSLQTKQHWVVGSNKLHYTAVFGLQEIMERLLDNGAEAIVNYCNNSDETPLCLAARLGSVGIVTTLLSHFADANRADSMGRTPLWWACYEGHEEVVRQLLQYPGTNIESTGRGIGYFSTGRTPLSVAAERGREGVVKLLLEQKVNADAKDYHSRTPLYYAAREGRDNIVALFLETAQGVKLDAFDVTGDTPLIIALKKGHKSVAERLLRAGARIQFPDGMATTTALAEAVRSRNMDIVSFILDNGVRVDEKDVNEQTALFFTIKEYSEAPETSRPELAKFLLEKGADPNVQNWKGLTPLIHARARRDDRVAEVLLDFGVDMERAAYDGCTALITSIRTEKTSEEGVRKLIEKGAKLDTRGPSGRTALGVAVAEHHPDWVRILLEAKANPNAKDYTGATPLHIAASEKHTAFVRALLEAGADPNIIDSQKCTPLHYAARHANAKDVIKLLVGAGAHVDAVDSVNETALWGAVRQGCVDTCTALLEAWADPNMVIGEDTPFSRAILDGKKDIIKILFEKFGDEDWVKNNKPKLYEKWMKMKNMWYPPPQPGLETAPSMVALPDGTVASTDGMSAPERRKFWMSHAQEAQEPYVTILMPLQTPGPDVEDPDL